MFRHRLTPFIALVLLCASVLTTEATETWSRLAVLEAVTSQRVAPSPAGHRTQAARTVRPNIRPGDRVASRPAQLASAPDDVVDIPVWAAPDMTPLRPSFPSPTVCLFVDTVPHGIETRGPPARRARRELASLRAPPSA